MQIKYFTTSYPKSGNTLLRYILIALFFTKDGVFTFNKSKIHITIWSDSTYKENRNIFAKFW